MFKDIGNGIYSIDGIIYTDDEWIKAWSTDEPPIYYKCEMLNHGQCYKLYKPSVAKLILKRGGYLNITQIG